MCTSLFYQGLIMTKIRRTQGQSQLCELVIEGARQKILYTYMAYIPYKCKRGYLGQHLDHLQICSGCSISRRCSQGQNINACRDECIYVCISVCVCTVLKRKDLQWLTSGPVVSLTQWPTWILQGYQRGYCRGHPSPVNRRTS